MFRLQQRVWLLFALVVIGSSPSTRVLAYVIGGRPWPGSPVTITYSYINMFDGGIRMPDGNPLPNWLIRGSIEESLRLWSSVVPVHFVEVADSPLSQLRFRHLYINGPDPPPPAQPIAKAQATCIGYGSGCQVQFDNGDRWQQVGTLPNPDILGASIHEVGHILGLGHTDVVGANMYWIFRRFSGLGTGQLFPDDIAGIQVLYGPGVGSVTPLRIVPEPATATLLLFAAGWFFLRRRPARLP